MIKSKKDNRVFYISLILVFLVVFWAMAFPLNFENITGNIFSVLVDGFSWTYVTAMLLFVIFSVGLAFSKYGNIKLGPDDSKPDYSYMSWIAMLFSAGMGIGLVFWGIAEPMQHYMNPLNGQPATEEAMNFAMKTSFFHWGIHPWAAYSILALALGYFQFRKNKPALISSIFIPLLGEERVNGPIGKTIDIVAVLATVVGVANSLGLGTLQINSGLNYLFGVPVNTLVQILIVAIVTALFMASAVAGLDKGIKFLSNLNLGVAVVLMLLAMFIGPTIKILNTFFNGMGIYLNDFIRESLYIQPVGKNSWQGSWTIYYWATWIAWAPFVGTFIARISRGRTIREFVVGVILIPSIGSFLWFATFGTLGINLGKEIVLEASKVLETGLFVVMQHYPLGYLVSLVAILLVCTFFVTSADSATFVLGMMTSNGDLNPSAKRKVIWGIIQSLLALSLLIAGGLKIIQMVSIIASFPFAIIMVLGCVSLLKALKKEESCAGVLVTEKSNVIDINSVANKVAIVAITDDDDEDDEDEEDDDVIVYESNSKGIKFNKKSSNLASL